MGGLGKQGFLISLLHDFARIHYDEAVTGFPDYSQIMSNEEDGALFTAHGFQKVENLRGDGHVQGCGGFVGYDELRLVQKGPWQS